MSEKLGSWLALTIDAGGRASWNSCTTSGASGMSCVPVATRFVTTTDQCSMSWTELNARVVGVDLRRERRSAELERAEREGGGRVGHVEVHLLGKGHLGLPLLPALYSLIANATDQKVWGGGAEPELAGLLDWELGCSLTLVNVGQRIWRR